MKIINIKPQILKFFVTVLVFLWPLFSFAISEYSITDLGLYRALSINESGDVVGIDRINNCDYPYMWTQDKGKIEIQTIGGVEGWALDINNHGQVVGYIEVEERKAFIWTEESGMQELPGGNVYSAAIAINDIGQIVGEIDDYPVLWTQNREVINIGSLVGAALDINNSGKVLIHTEDDRAFIWTEETGMQQLTTLGGEGSTARKINNIGHVVGWSQNATGNYHAFLWTEEGGIVDLGTLGGPQSIALSINNLGQIVGHSDITTPSVEHAFLWQTTTDMIDLNELKPANFSGILEAAFDINDAGQIVGNTSNTAFFMAPIPDEPNIEAILYFFDESVASGSLTGNGPGDSADGRLYALRNMLVEAGVLIDSGITEEACGQLMAVYKKCDSEEPEFVDGTAVPTLSEMILDLMEYLGCN